LLDPRVATQGARATPSRAVWLSGSPLYRKGSVKSIPRNSKEKERASDKMLTCSFSVNSKTLLTPSPPRHFPLPALSERRANSCTITGYRRSRISTSPIRVLVMCVWTPEVPCQLGPAPEPPAIV
jgi:hypothetical protein